MDSPSLETFRSCLGMVLGSQVSVVLPEQRGWTRWLPEVPSKLSLSVTPWFLSWFLSVDFAPDFPVLLVTVTKRDRNDPAALRPGTYSPSVVKSSVWSKFGVVFHNPHFRENYWGGVSAEVRGGMLFSHKQWKTVLQDRRRAFIHKWLCISPAVSKQLTSPAVSPEVYAHTPWTFWKIGDFHPLPPLHLSPSITLITQPLTWPFPVKTMPLTGKRQPPFFIFFCFGFFYFFFLFSVLLCLCFFHPGCCAALAESTVRWWLSQQSEEAVKGDRQGWGRVWKSAGEAGLASLNLCPKMHFIHLLTLIILSAADKPEYWAQNDR